MPRTVREQTGHMSARLVTSLLRQQWPIKENLLPRTPSAKIFYHSSPGRQGAPIPPATGTFRKPEALRLHMEGGWGQGKREMTNGVPH